MATEPRKREKPPFAFGYGAVPLMLLLPPLVYYLWICAEYYQGELVIPHGLDELRALFGHVPAPTLTSIGIFVGWYLFQGLLQIYAPGKWAEGQALSDGTRLKYKMNGWFSWWFTWACIAAGVATGIIPMTILHEQFGPLLTVTNIFAFGFSLYLYIHGKVRPDDGKNTTTGYPVHDYFLGTALNPRIGNFDFKLFCEARPGLIGWVVINLSLMAQQYHLHGTVSVPMILVNVFQFWYITDYYLHEEAILSTWDIRHENFGWMLCWGDLAWVPFTYTLQAFYLVHHPHSLPIWAIAGIVILNCAGYYIFRAVNIQKHKFRKDPERPIWGKKPEFIRTAHGSLLLISGWWGVGRHLNYLGDLMMALAWCLPCGFGSVLPYFYIIYFTILLVHRERRDHVTCAAKYGADWDAYCAKVRWRILPGIY
jgi:protein-S-isoprenylcysteine O-methyltransferase Ste14